MVRNIKLTLQYDGTRYHGWQSAKRTETATISGKLCEVLSRMTGEDISLFCAEKTDSGMHANMQIANFKTSSSMSPSEIRQYLNHYLPMDIAILNVSEASERFHSELNAHMITYTYCIQGGTVANVFHRKYTDYRTTLPDITLMQEAATHLCGTHDFRNFSNGKQKKSTTRTVSSIQFETTGTDSDEPVCIITLTANGFLKQMPQKLIGVLLEAGYQKQPVSYIQEIFDGTKAASKDCSNHAFCLTHIDYVH